MTRSGAARRRVKVVSTDTIIVGSVIGFFVILTLVFLYPLSFQLATHAHETGDTLLNTWILAWGTRTLFSNPLQLYDGNIFYPFPYSTAFSEVEVGSLPIVAPVIWLTGNPLLAHNVLVVASFALSAIGAYFLARHLTQSHLAGLVAGIIFGFAPYRFAQLAHVQLLATQWIPFALLFLHLAGQYNRWRFFLLFSLFFTLEALSSFYYAFFLAVAVGLYVLFWLVMHWRSIPFSLVYRFCAVCTLAGIIIMPFILPYFQAQREYSFNRNLAEVQDLSASLQDYMVAPPNNRLYGKLTAPLTSQTTWPAEHYLFPGVLAVLLGLVGIRFLKNAPTRRVMPYYIVLVIAMFILSFGPTLQLSGQNTGIALPYLLLYEFVPGFKGIRAVTRFSIILMLGLAVLAGWGAAWLQTKVKGAYGASAQMVVSGLLVAVLCLEYAALPIPVTPIPTGSAITDVYQWLATQDETTPIIELPTIMGAMPFWYMYYSTHHWHKLVNGHSGFVPPQYFELVRIMEEFPEPRTLALLRDLGVRLLVVHKDKYPAEKRQALDNLTATTDLRLVQSFGNDLVFELPPGPVHSAPVDLRISLDGKVAAGELLNLRVSVLNESSQPLTFRPIQNLEVIARWSGPTSVTHTYRVPMPIQILANYRERVYIDLEAPSTPGEYRLELDMRAPNGERRVERNIDVR